MAESGHISIDTENILPIIKKWLYSEKDIFLRELVSNAADALQKLEKLVLVGEADADAVGDAKIVVAVDKDKKTLSISDAGLGMTADEVKRYINQVAFSGVKDFVEKYQGKDEQSQIIGHFGLGFYSAFMVATRVEIESLSYQKDAKPVHWSCAGDTAYDLAEGSRDTVGTTITLHLEEESQDLLEPHKLRSVLDRYCAFIRFPIEVDGVVVNDPKPIWTRSTTDLKDEDYQQFYTRLFPLAPEPIFWIHLNVDYPFNLRGVLYFPKISHEFSATEGEVKLFCNQVFVADNCKELLPEYLTVLRGVIDCPDLPLNVSRSYLQGDPKVRKITEFISKKIADKLTGFSKTEREHYLKIWDDISGFIKYAMMRDPKFFERLKDHLVFKSTSGEYQTLEQYVEEFGEQTSGKIIYASDEVGQASMISMMKEHGVEVMLATSGFDKHFLPYLEAQSAKKYEFQRIDSDVLSLLIDSSKESTIVDPKDQKKPADKLKEMFEQQLGDKKVAIRVESLRSDKLPAMLVESEQDRRSRDMAEFMPFPMASKPEAKETLVVNSNCVAVQNLLKLASGVGKQDEVRMVIDQIYDLAFLQQGKFNAESMQAFIDRSVGVLGKLGNSLG